MPAVLTKKDLLDALKTVATKKDLENFATKQDLDNKIDEALADFRMSLNKDFDKFATKEDLEKFATKEDVEQIVAKSKTELTDYIHEVADTIIGAIDDINDEHLAKHHPTISLTTI